MKWVLRAFGAFIDGLQFMFMIAFVALQFSTPVGGGIAGAAAGAYFCWNASTGVVSGLIEAGKCAAGYGLVAAGASAFAIPMGAVFDFAISVTFGGGLIVLLALNGMFYPKIILASFGVEMLPFFNILPGWTGLAWAATAQKEKEEKKKREEAAVSEEQEERQGMPEAETTMYSPEEESESNVGPGLTRRPFVDIRPQLTNENFDVASQKRAA